MAAGFVEHAAIIAGWPVQVIDTLMSRFLPPYLGTMTRGQRAEVEAAHAVIARAARAYRASSDIGPSEPEASDEAEDLSRDDKISSAEAADMLRVGQRQVCKLAAVWEGHGLARRVGRTWLIDRDAVMAYRDRQGRQLSA